MRGDAPHFCNFVSNANLHDKSMTPTPRADLELRSDLDTDVLDLETETTDLGRVHVDDLDIDQYGSQGLSGYISPLNPPNSEKGE